ncbi:hypothetical protein D3C78_1346480 [compost metagenome]
MANFRQCAAQVAYSEGFLAVAPGPAQYAQRFFSQIGGQVRQNVGAYRRRGARGQAGRKPGAHGEEDDQGPDAGDDPPDVRIDLLRHVLGGLAQGMQEVVVHALAEIQYPRGNQIPKDDGDGDDYRAHNDSG